MSHPVIRARELHKSFGQGPTRVEAVRAVSLDVRAGEIVALFGVSGCGKTTLMRLLGGLIPPTSGRVDLDRVELARLTPDELAWVRCRKVGYIFQTFELIPTMTCLENATLPMAWLGAESHAARDKGMALLERVGLAERALHKPNELSGGQQQRVAIARALANDPSVIFADEPTGNLDRATGESILELLAELADERGAAILGATHDPKMTRHAHRAIVMSDGAVDWEGPAAEAHQAEALRAEG